MFGVVVLSLTFIGRLVLLGMQVVTVVVGAVDSGNVVVVSLKICDNLT